MTPRKTTTLQPRVLGIPVAQELFLRAASVLAEMRPPDVEDWRNEILEEITELELSEGERLELRIAISTLCDLRSHRWNVTADDSAVEVGKPDREALDPQEHKARIREGLLIERDAQLREDSTRRFIKAMERRRPHNGEWVSIFSVMRDGKELAGVLRDASALPDGPARVGALKDVIEPYVQVVERGETCPHTGFDLQDIWRYFRHTWVTPYRSVPGRQISFLVRDAAAPHHPVMGIGSLASSVVQQKQRDKWIGWHPETFFEILKEDQYKGWAGWVTRQLDRLLDEVYIGDFLEEGLLDRGLLVSPSEEVIDALDREAEKARDAHRLNRQEEQHKRAGRNSESTDWGQLARTYLYRSKRARSLADLLRARRQLIDVGFTKNSPERLKRAAESAEGRRAIKTILRRVKASHVGIDMMDIAVCGAVAPYNPILGGKLVSLLMASPDVVRAYRDRYSDASSIIASSMAGQKVTRKPRLVLLMTTSLYRVAASQYNRLKVPPEAFDGRDVLEYVDLEHTAGFGSYHFSKPTMASMEVLLSRSERGREVNSIFGEGVNPKLRKVRSALGQVGLPSDQLLLHGSERIVYGVPLAENFRDILLHRAKRPKYIVPQSEEGTQSLIDYWFERWLSGRIAREGVLEAVEENELSYPVDHGARVDLPQLEEEVGPLFEEP